MKKGLKVRMWGKWIVNIVKRSERKEKRLRWPNIKNEKENFRVNVNKWKGTRKWIEVNEK